MSVTVSAWSRRYALISAFALVCWQVGIVFEVPRRTEIALGLFGFVFHMVFGKAYALVPSYFDSELAFPWAPKTQFPLVVVGTAGLVVSSLGIETGWLTAGSAALWFLGVAVFVGTLVSTIGRALIRGETGTGEHNAERLPVDRLANGFVPVALSYLLVGSYEIAALYGPLPALFGGAPAQASHLLAAGTAAVLVFALGFRLLPRFLVVSPPLWVVRIVLPAAAAGPVLIAAGLEIPRLQIVGAALEAVAVCLFAAALARMFVRSDRRRVGLYGVLAGAGSGVGGVLLGLVFAFDGTTAPLTTLHFRLNVLGFLGLTVVGLAYQFYPPSVGEFPGSSERTAALSILGICAGLLTHAISLRIGLDALTTVGYLPAFGGSVLYAYLLVSAFFTRM
ncbi:hypothetical protein [Natronomonas sp. LN261]|uniref:hypothetical protein n=1 Tax=Natronomonas sp. LN261 TaxID=2750669 RepID=UPI0015EE8D60|nr:hypothetical protein [Natronomonas sp. LN261]